MKTTTLLDYGGAGAAPAAASARPVERRSPNGAAAHPAPETLAERNRLLEMQNRELKLAVRRLRQLAYVDGLTGLANRRCFELALRSEVRRACRTGAPLSLVLCDVDHFKALNDRLGHRTGDSVLSMIGSALRGLCRRAGDLAARYGGEEFALLLPATAFRDAMDMAERLRRGVEALRVRNIEEDRQAGVTVSIGVTTFHSRTPCKPSRLIRVADTALYQAKEAGRNRTRYQLMT